MTVGIFEESHPQIVVVHGRDPVRRMGERHAAPLQFGDRQRDVGAAEIDAALRLEFRRVRRLVEQEAHAGAVKNDRSPNL